MTVEELKASGTIIFECIAGSKAYGLASSTSDTDIRGVFIAAKKDYYSFKYVDQVNDEKNDVVYYELNKFIELCAKNNPNVLELFNIPQECIVYQHELFASIRAETFLSKLCEKTFANYAYVQIKKARGLNKKIVNPMEKERKTPMLFCYVHEQKKSLALLEYLKRKKWKAERCGLSKIPHLKDCYHLYYSVDEVYNGIVRKSEANELSLSSISKEAEPEVLLYFNKDGYSTYCKEYKQYWEWVEKRNEARYQTTVSHQKNYDSKNMMHTFRLLHMAEEIAKDGVVNVRRNDRDFLLQIKAGEFEYEELVKWAEEKKEQLSELFKNSQLLLAPDMEKVNALMVELREEFYKM